MARTPDKPGTYRVKAKGGVFVLSAVDAGGKRIKLEVNSREQGERLARDILGINDRVGNTSGSIGPIQQSSAPTPQTPLDDFGLPISLRVSPETVASVQQSFGLGTGQPAATTPTPVNPKDVEEKRVKRAKQAKSLMELAGISLAAGDVWLARKVCDWAGKEPVNPNPRQVNDLAEVTKETFAEWFGDREVKPWQMMFLLAIGIPISMLIQSPKKASEPEAKLKSVP